MQLRYRGRTYESHPAQIERVETGLMASFRGLSYPVRRCVNLCIPQKMVQLSLLKAAAGRGSSRNLRYRGVSYIKGKASLTPSST